MIIGHFPAGYILSKRVYQHYSKQIIDYKKFVFWGMLGSIAPDFDMFYFYFVDHGKIHHHKYFSHYPIFWLVTFGVFYILTHLGKAKNQFVQHGLIFSFAGFLHMILDSIVGDIWWFAPWVDKSFALAVVPAIYKPWWVNFIFHWSFGLEILLCVFAFLMWKSKTK